MKKTKQITVGNVPVGGGAPIAVQSMCLNKTKNIDAVVEEIYELEKVGCQIIRVAVPDQGSVESLCEIKKQIDIPLVADIHFNLNLAISAASYVDKLRINANHIKDGSLLKNVASAAKDYNLPIRVGINSGSLDRSLIVEEGSIQNAMVAVAIKQINTIEKYGFNQLIISLKSSDVRTTIDAYRLFSSVSEYPLHVGITQTGIGEAGIIKSAIGIGSLLNDGIGDTIRVSITSDDRRDEVRVAYKILDSLGLNEYGRNFISCPVCGRSDSFIIPMMKEIEMATEQIQEPIKIAVMGCVVNGPGEAEGADIGLFRKGYGIMSLYVKNKGFENIPYDSAVEVFFDRLNDYTKEHYNKTYDFRRDER